jgi:type I restriction enzyme M protein
MGSSGPRGVLEFRRYSRKLVTQPESALPLQPYEGRALSLMAIKKSELYSKLWASCDELRGGMDASQYKDYVLVLLFIKYISDKFAGQPYAAIKIPKGASFSDMVALKGKADIGDQINKQIIAPLAVANQQLSQSDFPDFNDSVKLGDGKEKVDKLTNLISIFQDKALDFSKNRAEGDDILGDAYEYLMRHFATESGKSKGQFYTPAEVSRVIAKTIGINKAKTKAETTVYDPTCGSGSLLLKVADEATTALTLYGQEKDATTSGLARMNMILHNNPNALITQGNTLADPKFRNGDALEMFDFVVANPPFSDKRWSTGFDPNHDLYGRFEHFGVPPNKQGDFAYLLHIIRSLKRTGKGACILPHGVLFRGNAEAEIRRNLIRKGYIKGIIGLPPNLFYGTAIPACIMLVDKEDAHTRKGIFMIDASAAFIKDGPKNRLRDQDIHKIVDVFTKLTEKQKYARMVSFEEIERNEFNLNLARYIDSFEPEDLQDINAHLRGGIPTKDIDALVRYWQIMPGLRKRLFADDAHEGYNRLTVPIPEIKLTIFGHPEFTAFKTSVARFHSRWEERNTPLLKGLAKDDKPKELIETVAEDLLATFEKAPLLDRYDIYQHLMDYWAETMQDDCYAIAIDGWVAETYRIVVKDKKGKDKDKGWACDLVPKPLIVARYFSDEQEEITRLELSLEALTAEINEMEEEHSGEEGAFSEIGKVTLTAVRSHLKYLAKEGGELDGDDRQVLLKYIDLCTQETILKRDLSAKVKELDAKAYEKYPKLSGNEIKVLVVDDKWLAAIAKDIRGELDQVSRTLTGRVRILAERYETPLPILNDSVAALSARVDEHLSRMGQSWN